MSLSIFNRSIKFEASWTVWGAKTLSKFYPWNFHTIKSLNSNGTRREYDSITLLISWNASFFSQTIQRRITPKILLMEEIFHIRSSYHLVFTIDYVYLWCFWILSEYLVHWIDELINKTCEFNAYWHFLIQYGCLLTSRLSLYDR